MSSRLSSLCRIKHLTYELHNSSDIFSDHKQKWVICSFGAFFINFNQRFLEYFRDIVRLRSIDYLSDTYILNLNFTPT